MAPSPRRSSSGYVLNGHCSCNRTSPDSPRSCVWVGRRPGPLATRRPTRAGVFPACWCRSRGLHPTTAYAARRAATLTPVSGYTDAWLAVGRCQWGPRVGGPVASPPVLPRRRWAAGGGAQLPPPTRGGRRCGVARGRRCRRRAAAWSRMVLQEATTSVFLAGRFGRQRSFLLVALPPSLDGDVSLPTMHVATDAVVPSVVCSFCLVDDLWGLAPIFFSPA